MLIGVVTISKYYKCVSLPKKMTKELNSVLTQVYFHVHHAAGCIKKNYNRQN
jgi:hypothetical protein